MCEASTQPVHTACLRAQGATQVQGDSPPSKQAVQTRVQLDWPWATSVTPVSLDQLGMKSPVLQIILKMRFKKSIAKAWLKQEILREWT